jgi:hypothetical protein
MNKVFSNRNAVRVLGVLAALAFLVSFSAGAQAPDSITGTVRNQSRGGVAPGDEVILLRLDQGMQEETRSKTDSQGAFNLKLQSPAKLYLVRIVHQGVNYDQRATAGTTLALDVFDAAPKVQGLAGSIEIIRTGTTGNVLHVSDMIEIRNEAKPPLTQAGERTFDVYLPPKAKVDTVMAASAGKMAVLISASPVPGEAGHFTVNFPLRPGATQFAFNYNLPYDGRAVFHPRLAYPMRQLAVMMPPTMKFTSSSTAFRPLDPGVPVDYKVQAANQLTAGEAPSFELSGAGAIPALQGRVQGRPGPQAAPNQGSLPLQPAAPASNGSGSQTQPPAQGAARPVEPSPVTPAVAVSALEWWILGGLAVVVLGTCGFVIWRTNRRSRSTAEAKAAPAGKGKKRPAAASTTPSLEALKQELLDLETSRLEGSISREEYEKAKQALDGTVQQALARATGKP